eukprot:m.116447 g.116447  ORF g.116447 m.116447 type:complete len:1044 (+) comp28503_c0_seq1:289-3420(+)
MSGYNKRRAALEQQVQAAIERRKTAEKSYKEVLANAQELQPSNHFHVHTTSVTSLDSPPRVQQQSPFDDFEEDLDATWENDSASENAASIERNANEQKDLENKYNQRRQQLQVLIDLAVEKRKAAELVYAHTLDAATKGRAFEQPTVKQSTLSTPPQQTPGQIASPTPGTKLELAQHTLPQHDGGAPNYVVHHQPPPFLPQPLDESGGEDDIAAARQKVGEQIDALSDSQIQELWVKVGKPQFTPTLYRTNNTYRKMLCKKVEALKIPPGTLEMTRSSIQSITSLPITPPLKTIPKAPTNDIDSPATTLAPTVVADDPIDPKLQAVLWKHDSDGNKTYLAALSVNSPQNCSLHEMRPCRCAKQCVGVFPIKSGSFATAMQMVNKLYKKCTCRNFQQLDDAIQWIASNSSATASNQRDPSTPNKPTTKVMVLSPSQGQTNEGSVFKAKNKPDSFTEFKKVIGTGNVERYRTLVQQHPNTFLVGKTDRESPAVVFGDVLGPAEKIIMREKKAEYWNAVHQASIANRANIVVAVIEEVEKYVDNLPAQDANSNQAGGSDDYYLGIKESLIKKYLTNAGYLCADKSVDTRRMHLFGNTPLHEACLWGSVEVVDLLLSFQPIVNADTKNAAGLRPVDLIDEKYQRRNYSQDHAERMRAAFEQRWYVPAFEGDDLTPVKIGPAWSPELSKTTPEGGIVGLAGPMTRTAAEELHKKWTSPSRADRSLFREWRRCDAEKGQMEGGRVLTARDGIGWEEYWPFLNRLCNLAAAKGLNDFENYLAVNSFSFIDGQLPTGTDCDVCAAVSHNVLLKWITQFKQPGDHTFSTSEEEFSLAHPHVWRWCQTIQQLLLHELDLENADATKTRTDETVFIHTLTALKTRIKNYHRLEKRVPNSMVPHSPLASPKKIRTPRSLIQSSSSAMQCCALSSCNRVNACGCSSICRSPLKVKPTAIPTSSLRQKLDFGVSNLTNEKLTTRRTEIADIQHKISRCEDDDERGKLVAQANKLQLLQQYEISGVEGGTGGDSTVKLSVQSPVAIATQTWAILTTSN